MKSTKRTVPLLVYLFIMIGVVFGSVADIHISPVDVVGEQMTIQGLRVVEKGEVPSLDNSSFNKIQEAKAAFKRGELYWLTMNIYHEARGEDEFGMLMIAFVTLDRLHDGRWGSTIKEVVTSPNQFSWYDDGKSDIPKDSNSWEEAKRVAIFAQTIFRKMGNRLDVNHYHNHDVNPEWAKSMKKVLVVGNHIFYTDRLTN